MDNNEILKNAPEDMENYFHSKNDDTKGEYVNNSQMYIHNLDDIRQIEELKRERDELKVVVSYLDAKITSASNCHEMAVPFLLDEALNRSHLDFHREKLKELNNG
jgi:hypothetical protein